MKKMKVPKKDSFINELYVIIHDLEDEVGRLYNENGLLRAASVEQRNINGSLREENKELTQKLRALEADY